MDGKAQGAIEYLLIIGAAILVVAIVIIAMVTLSGSASTNVDDSSGSLKDPLKELVAEKQNQYFIPARTTRYYEFVGTTITLGQLASSGKDIVVCYYTNCSNFNPNLAISGGTTVQITTDQESGVVDQTNLISLLEVTLDDWVEDDIGLKWSPSLGAYANLTVDEIKSVCDNQGNGVRLPTRGELENALNEHFTIDQNLGFLYNTDYWAIGYQNCVGLSRMWWYGGEITINECFVDTTTTRGNIKCVYE